MVRLTVRDLITFAKQNINYFPHSKNNNSHGNLNNGESGIEYPIIFRSSPEKFNNYKV